MSPRFYTIALLLLTNCIATAAPNDPVVLREQGELVTLSNGLCSFTAKKSDATISRMTLGNSPNLAGRGAYFAVLNSVGKDGGDLHRAQYNVMRNTPDLVEIAMGAPIGGVHFAVHYILRRGDPGFYVFVLEQRRRGDPPENDAQVRWSFYLNNQLFDYQLVTDKEQGLIPDLAGAPSVQDATFRLKDGTVYTKYNYCSYLEDDLVHGICGSRPGNYGAFIVTPSIEYLQAPTKQDIMVHAGPIIHRILQSGHFEPRELTGRPIPEGWTKLCGPWLVYLNTGDSPAQMWNDAKAQGLKEKAKWPYAWMANPEYPLEKQRGEVSGTLKLFDGSKPAANALMVLTSPDLDWQIQELNYIFSTRADGDGKFTLPHVRPGSYTLFSMIPGITDEFRKDNIVVTPGGKIDLGTMVFPTSYYSVKLWEIGYADRRTTGFKLSDQPRGYGSADAVPANLNFLVGTSTPANDWYFAQAKPGDWNINFKMDRAYGGNAILTIGIAGQTSDPEMQILVNNRPAGAYKGANSSALYRSAILGSSYFEKKIIRFPASILSPAGNTITFRLAKGSIMYDVIKLEIDDPRIPKKIPTLAEPPAVN